ncbi:MAG: AMP-binding protein, partial [Gammaproteobacteria bacterium]|nr:AMP-binding protein [Gammaproteobacteria bacterium]
MSAGERIADIVTNNARIRGDQPAVVHGTGILTFAQFADRALRLGNALAAAGLGHGDRVAILAQNSPDFLVICAACEAAGLIAAPINYRLAAREVRQ